MPSRLLPRNPDYKVTFKSFAISSLLCSDNRKWCSIVAPRIDGEDLKPKTSRLKRVITDSEFELSRSSYNNHISIFEVAFHLEESLFYIASKTGSVLSELYALVKNVRDVVFTSF